MATGTLNLYQMDPAVYDDYISIPLERRNFEEVFGFVSQNVHYQNARRIIDFCCGTGIFPRKWLSKLEGITYTGIDSNGRFIEFAKERLAAPKFSFHIGDAVSMMLEDSFDIALATSAYHHIPDERKQDFLGNINRHLMRGGDLIVYEKFLEPFAGPIDAAKKGTAFYSERIGDMMQEGPLSENQLFALYNELYLTSVRKEEYKVPLERFMQDALAQGFYLIQKKKLWPRDARFGNPDVGDFVIVLRKT